MVREEGGDSGLRGDGSRSALTLPYSAMAEGWYVGGGRGESRSVFEHVPAEPDTATWRRRLDAAHAL